MNNILSTKLETILYLGIAFICLLLIFVILFSRKKKVEPHYILKDKLLTRTELEYYNIINSFFGQDYLILPQINLASIIDKEGGGFRNELFRNVDFGIFDFNFRPILLIEINDNTHFRKDRAERDKKVLDICQKTHIPLVTFWVKDGINKEYIYKTLKKYL